MIRVTKPGKAPPILGDPEKRGKKAAQDLCDAYDRGTRSFEFDSSIYGAKSVKNALIKAQRDKCCFCESKITHISYGDVEHFRPKGGYRQDSEDELHQPGYYWLAYEWANIYLSCQLCNQCYKRNLFPLQNPKDRAESHHEDLAKEKPLFIDPAADDPAQYIGFRQEYAYAIEDNPRGQQTISAPGLNREALAEKRLDRLRQADLLLKTVRLFETKRNDGKPLSSDEEDLLQRHRARLEEMQKDDAEYAAMVRAAVAANP